MNYNETLDFLYNKTPMFQSIGAGAYKPGLNNVLAIAALYDNPHKKIKTIHVGGTNGKGSVAHTLAAILQAAGYRTGLFTSPHLVDFRERIRIDGEMIPEDEVTGFVERFIALGGESLQPSFFELTTVMALDYFARKDVDIAVMEVGLGGRLDCTNIITPELSIITNISFDHTALLGNTLTQIATEKAGIIKPHVPVVIGESDGAVREVFAAKADATASPIYFADDSKHVDIVRREPDDIIYRIDGQGELSAQLTGDCQPKNTATIICAVERLKGLGYTLPFSAVAEGFGHVCQMTGLMGRWMKLSDKPVIICDTGHNPGGWTYLSQRLDTFGDKLHIVIGFVSDKDVSAILSMMPRKAHYHFVSPSVKRGMDSFVLAAHATEAGLTGTASPTLGMGIEIALSAMEEGDTLFVGGSTFVVADLMQMVADGSLDRLLYARFH